MPAFVAEHVAVDQMQREEIEDEFAKITPDQIEQLDDDSKREIKIAQDNIAQLEEKLELYQLERAYKRWFWTMSYNGHLILVSTFFWYIFLGFRIIIRL